MTYFFVLAAVCVLFYVGWKLTSRTQYESAEYSVLQADGNIELREYPELMLVTTPMGSRLESDDGSFGRLFQYISGGNEPKQKIAMTTPVFMEPKSEASEGQMGFVIPKDVASTTIPAPDSDQVELTRRPGGKFALIRFAGQVNEEVSRKRLSELETWIAKQGLKVIGEPEVAAYDPPWTPGPLRRNEILLRVSSPS